MRAAAGLGPPRAPRVGEQRRILEGRGRGGRACEAVEVRLTGSQPRGPERAEKHEETHIKMDVSLQLQRGVAGFSISQLTDELGESVVPTPGLKVGAGRVSATRKRGGGVCNGLHRVCWALPSDRDGDRCSLWVTLREPRGSHCFHSNWRASEWKQESRKDEQKHVGAAATPAQLESAPPCIRHSVSQWLRLRLQPREVTQVPRNVLLTRPLITYLHLRRARSEALRTPRLCSCFYKEDRQCSHIES